MIEIFTDDRAGGLERRDRAEDGCWISLVAPGADELAMLQGLGVPRSLLDHVRDPDEHPRLEHDGGALLVVLRHPAASAAPRTAAAPFETAPLSIVVTPRYVVTIAPDACPFVAELPRHAARTSAISTRQPMRFLLQLFARIAEEFLECMRRIDKEVERLEDELQRSLRN